VELPRLLRRKQLLHPASGRNRRKNRQLTSYATLGGSHDKPEIDGANRRTPNPPMLIPFPVACFVLAFVSDVAFWRTSNDFWATASLWLLGIGLIMAALAAVVGVIDLLGDDRIRNLNDAWLHAGGNVVAVLIELYNWYSRFEHGTSAIIPTGLVLSFVVVLILLFTGWKGWEMVYREHVGVSDVADQPR
jgi:uncharacterized membrane protein